jgi:hypothetical protein
MAIATSRIIACGCAAFLLVPSVAARADAVVVTKHENLEHYTVNTPTPAAESYSPFFTHHIGGTKEFLPSNGWTPLLTEEQPKVQAGTPGATSTTPKKTFTFVGDSTSAGNWLDGNGIPTGITLTFDAQLTITAFSLTPNDAPFLTVPGLSNTNQSGRGIGVTSVVDGPDDINLVPQRGLAFSPVTVSNVSFSGTLAEPGFTFTAGGVSGFGVELFASGVFVEGDRGMLLTQGEDGVADPGEETIGFGKTSGTLASGLAQNLNFGPYSPGPAGGSATPNDPSSVFPRQSGPFTLVMTESETPNGGGTIRGFTLGYDVTYDISPANAAEDADFNGDGVVDGTDFLTWQRGFGVGNNLSTGDANDDNVVDGADLAIWTAQFGSGAPVAAAAQIPEPAAAALVAIGSFAVLAARRRRS